MVERCADCGFDLAGGLVEVVPTAHYMMGGVMFNADCSTAVNGLFAAGEDTGGVHGANRLGGNGVANSTVFGGIAGDTMAAWVPQHGTFRAPDGLAVARSIEAHEVPFRNKPANIEPIREELYSCMWDDAGILRDARGLKRAQSRLHELQLELARSGVPGDDRAFNVSWHDWLNLRSLVETSQAITAAALVREDSRGAHFREDFPESGSPETSSYTVIRRQGDALSVTTEPVQFTRVRPGESLIA